MSKNSNKPDTGKRYTEENKVAVKKLASSMSAPDIAKKLRLHGPWVAWQVRLIRNAGGRVFAPKPTSKPAKSKTHGKPAKKRPLGKTRKVGGDDLLS